MNPSPSPLFPRILLGVSWFVLGLVLMLAVYVGFIMWELFQADGFFSGVDLRDRDSAVRRHFWTELAIALVNGFAAFLLWRKKWKLLSLGVALPLIIGFIQVASRTSSFVESYQREPFDSVIWKTSDPRSLSMARTLVEEDLLVGKSYQELEEMLGPGRHSDMVDNDNVWFWVINGTWHLRVVTEKDTAQYAYIWMPGMWY
jgi:hypothetical protein